MVEKKIGARIVLELRMNVPRSKEYARMFQPPKLLLVAGSRNFRVRRDV